MLDCDKHFPLCAPCSMNVFITSCIYDRSNSTPFCVPFLLCSSFYISLASEIPANWIVLPAHARAAVTQIMDA